MEDQLTVRRRVWSGVKKYSRNPMVQGVAIGAVGTLFVIRYGMLSTIPLSQAQAQFLAENAAVPAALFFTTPIAHIRVVAIP